MLLFEGKVIFCQNWEGYEILLPQMRVCGLLELPLFNIMQAHKTF